MNKETLKGKLLLVGSLVLLLLSIFTCNYQRKQIAKSLAESQDTTILNALKKTHLKVQKKYTQQITQLNKAKDSLGKEVKNNKRELAVYKAKSNYLRDELKARIISTDTVNCDVIKNIALRYIQSNNENDSLCTETIKSMEAVIENRDSSEVAHQNLENSLRDLQKEQELRAQYLTQQINVFHKQLKRKSRQNIILKGGLFILTSVSASLLITQAVK